MNVQFTCLIDLHEKLKLHYLEVEETVLRELADTQTKSIYNQRVEITVNEMLHWKGGTVALGNGNAYLTISAARMKKLGVTVGDKVRVTLRRDESEFGFEVPIEFEEVLRQDHQANARFQQLNKGFQRYIIYMVMQYRTTDKRIEKSLFYLENLKKAPVEGLNMRHILGKA